MSKCNICHQVKGKRRCKLENDEFICPKCCATKRNTDCIGCSNYGQAKNFENSKKEIEIEKEKRKEKENIYTNEIHKIYENQVESIIHLAEQGQVEMASTQMKALYLDLPNTHCTNFGMGVICYLQDNKDEALAYCDKAIELSPMYSEAWLFKAYIHRDREELLECFTSLKKVVSFGIKGTPADIKATEILDSYEKIIMEKEGVDLDAYIDGMGAFKIGANKMKNKKFDIAILYFKKVLEIIPNHYESYGSMGMCYAFNDDIKTAKGCLEKAIDICPKYTYAITNLQTINNLKESEVLIMKNDSETFNNLL